MLAPLRPRRSLAFPFVVTLFPLLWTAVRGTTIGRGRGFAPDSLGFLAYVVGAVTVSYLVAAAVTAAVGVDAESLPVWAGRLLDPSNATLAVVGAVSVVLVAYVGGSFLVEFPDPVDEAARGVGVVLGWPLVVAVVATYAVGNAFPSLAVPFVVELAVTLAGVALSAVWIFCLSAGVAAAARRVR